MATKADVIKKAEQLGCSIEIDNMGIAVIAPKGYLIAGELHYSCFDWDNCSKSYIWSKLLSELSKKLEPCEGSKYCDCSQEVAA